MSFESWGIVEIMGHKVYAGKLGEETIAGVAMLRVDVPATEDIAEYTKFFGGSAIYAITPTDEASAKMAASKLRERPVSPYVLPALAAAAPPIEVNATRWRDDDEDDYDPDEDDEILDDDEDDDDPSGFYDDDEDEDDDQVETTARYRAANWAHSILNNFDEMRVLDCETTGIESGSEPVSIAVIDGAGMVLLDTLVKPSKPIPADASRIHGITDEIVADAPPPG